MGGPFAVPDIHTPPDASSEAVFLSGSVDSAPLYLNEFVLSRNGRSGNFIDLGWVDGSGFDCQLVENGVYAEFAWDLSGTGFAVSHISVNFDNNFYHVYEVNNAVRYFRPVTLTGNGRDVITHIRVFGYSVPDSDRSVFLLAISFSVIVAFSRRGFG